jgi:hypothetical protein
MNISILALTIIAVIFLLVLQYVIDRVYTDYKLKRLKDFQCNLFIGQEVLYGVYDDKYNYSYLRATITEVLSGGTVWIKAIDVNLTEYVHIEEIYPINYRDTIIKKLLKYIKKQWEKTCSTYEIQDSVSHN